jgi:hypothetical protein
MKTVGGLNSIWRAVSIRLVSGSHFDFPGTLPDHWNPEGLKPLHSPGMKHFAVLPRRSGEWWGVGQRGWRLYRAFRLCYRFLICFRSLS